MWLNDTEHKVLVDSQHWKKKKKKPEEIKTWEDLKKKKDELQKLVKENALEWPD